MREFFRQAPLTSLLIALNLLVYGATALYGGEAVTFGNRVLVACGGLYGPAVVEGGEWWRLLSAMFLHGGLEHLAFNMVSLLVVGRIMELSFSRRVYLAIYFASGMLGFLFSLFVHPATVIIGASGAIFGLFGAIGGFALFHRDRLGPRFRVFMREYGLILGLNLVIDLLVPSIDMSAHIGGLIFGVIGGYVAIRSSTAFWAFLVGAALLAVGSAAVWLPPRYLGSPIPGL